MREGFVWKLGIKFLDQIYARVVQKQTILMCLPAFPFKSPNARSKVLGTEADKEEEVALAHLNGLCAAIAHIYAPGARLMIISDGLVYNGLYPVLSFRLSLVGSERERERDRGWEMGKFLWVVRNVG